MAVRLFIGNLSYDTTEAELREYFSSVAQPGRVMLPVDRDTGRPRGFAFVEFQDREIADEAIRRFNNQPFKGRPLAVSEARPREEVGSGPRPVGGGFAPRPFRPVESSGPGVGPPAARERGFGPPAPPRRQRGPAGKKKAERGGPKGPIRERTSGRFFNVDDEQEGEEPIDFENFATSATDEEPDEEK